MSSDSELINFLNQHATRNWEIRFHGKLVDINYPDSPTTPDYEDYASLSEALAEVVKDCEKNIVTLSNSLTKKQLEKFHS